jgi:two-component system, LuxR family, sensor kinase FixL
MFSSETRAFIEAAVDAVIVIDHRGKITAVNDVTRELFGYSVAEMLGENVSLLMPEPDRSAHNGYLRQYLDTGSARIIGIGRRVTAQRKDGTLFPAQLSVGKIPDSDPPRFVGMLRDVTAEHEAMSALRLERDRANAYLELNDSILLKLDTRQRITEINARGADLLGAPRNEIHGADWLGLFVGDDDRARARQMLEGASASGSSREREYDSLDFAGEQRRIHWRCIALRASDGAPAGWLVAGVDVTERMRREEMAALAQDRMTRVARLASMGEMASGVAHELNQPLTAIATYARACERFLAMTTPDHAELALAVREIEAEGLRAGRIIERLRQLVRHDEPESLTPVAINSVIEELRALLCADARLFSANLEFALADGLPRIDGSVSQLQQLILNLVRNSLEALAEGPTGDRWVRLATRRNDAGQVELAVIDNGPGFPAEIADRLFHPFATTKKSGTGLGLAMSRTIVQNHGGIIGIGEAAPRGASVIVRLPPREEKT